MQVGNRIRGILYGAAIGDILGLSTEGMEPEDVEKAYSDFSKYTVDGQSVFEYKDAIRDAFRKKWEIGDWSANTDQTFMIIRSIILQYNKDTTGNKSGSNENPDAKYETKQQLYAYQLKNWIKNGFTTFGDKCGVGVDFGLDLWNDNINSSKDPYRAALEVWIYHPHYPCSYNTNSVLGTLSTISTIGYDNILKVVTETMIYCTTTHASPECVAASLFLNVLFSLILSFVLKKKSIASETDVNNLCNIVIQIIEPFVKNYSVVFHNCIQHIHEIHKNNLKRAKTRDTQDQISKAIITNLTKHYVEPDTNKIMADLKSYVFAKSITDLDLNNNPTYVFKPIGCACLALKQIVSKNGEFVDTVMSFVKMGGSAAVNCSIVGSIISSCLSKYCIPEKYITECKHPKILDMYIDLAFKIAIRLNPKEENDPELEQFEQIMEQKKKEDARLKLQKEKEEERFKAAAIEREKQERIAAANSYYTNHHGYGHHNKKIDESEYYNMC
jgi:ADP-ribosylglycohydrolase